MVCYLIKFGNEKPPRERFVVVLYFIPVCTGNAELLKMWGICNAYSSKCGYKNVSAMFSELYPRKNFVYIENELEFIDECMREAKNSRDESIKEQQAIAELYYKGIDIVVDGSDWSEKLTLRDIAKLKNTSKDTVVRRLKAFESYIVSKLSKREDITRAL